MSLDEKIYKKLVRLSKDPNNNELTFMRFVKEADVKQFIKELKEEEIGCDKNNPLANPHANYCGHKGYLCSKCKQTKYFLNKIDKVFGKGLI